MPSSWVLFSMLFSTENPNSVSVATPRSLPVIQFPVIVLEDRSPAFTPVPPLFSTRLPVMLVQLFEIDRPSPPFRRMVELLIPEKWPSSMERPAPVFSEKSQSVMRFAALSNLLERRDEAVAVPGDLAPLDGDPLGRVIEADPGAVVSGRRSRGWCSVVMPDVGPW